MKKYTSITIIALLLSYIIFSEVKLGRINKDLNRNIDSLNNIAIQLKISESRYYADFCFDWIQCHPYFPKVVIKGDSLTGEVGLLAGNSVFEGNGRRHAYVKLCEDIDSNWNLIGVYDSITAKDWRCQVNIKTERVGSHILKGALFIPVKNDSYEHYIFEIDYLVVDSSNTEVENLKKYNRW